MYDFFAQPWLGLTPPPLLLLLALIFNAYLGRARRVLGFLPHPLSLASRAASGLERKLNRDSRGQIDRAFRGLVVVLILAGVALAAGAVLSYLSVRVPFGWLVEVALLAAVIDGRSRYDEVRGVARALKAGGLDGGRRAVAGLVRRDPAYLDTHGVIRAAIESLAVGFLRGLAIPAFWYLLFGLPGVLLCQVVYRLDQLWGYETDRFRAFGLVAARLDDALAFIPSRLGALFLAGAALFVPKASPRRAIAVMARSGGKHRSLLAGWAVGAMAGALDLALAGPRRYRESVSADAWIGSGRARAEPADMKRALYQYAVACLLLAVLAVLGLAGALVPA